MTYSLGVFGYNCFILVVVLVVVLVVMVNGVMFGIPFMIIVSGDGLCHVETEKLLASMDV